MHPHKFQDNFLEEASVRNERAQVHEKYNTKKEEEFTSAFDVVDNF
jgi:hypothetical protein